MDASAAGAGHAFRRAQVVAMLVVGIAGVLIPGLQPQLLGALAIEGRLSVSALGSLATVELLAMGIAAGATGAVAGRSVRRIATVALLWAGACDLLTPLAGAATIFFARIGAGLGEGALIWIAIGFIVRSAGPERWSGIYLALQTLAQFALAALLGWLVLPVHGASGGFVALGIVMLAALIAVPGLPKTFAPVDAGDPGGSGGVLPPPRGIAALFGILLYLAFIVSVWVYVEPLALEHGVGAAIVRLVSPLSLAMQVLGAGCAALIAGRIPAAPTVIVAAAINLVLLAVMAAPPSPVWFVVATSVFGFLWLFVLPFQIPLVITADPTHRAGPLIGGAQLVGASLGPLLAGLLIGGGRVSPVLWLGAALAVAGCVTLLLAARGRRGGAVLA